MERRGKRAASPPASQTCKKRKKEAVEKREARYLGSPSKPVLERMERAFQHRLYLIDKHLVSDTSYNFVVLGATGNVYTATLQKRPSCTCPDFGRCHTCKHLLFVMLRVLKLPRADPRVWQKALLSSEVKELLQLAAAKDEAGVLASQRIRERFNELSGKGDGEKKNEEEEEEKSIRRSIEGDCPICYEAMAGEDGSPAEPLVFCNSCGNNVHKDCFQRWSNSKSSYAKVTCIYCRAVWEEEGAKAKGLNKYNTSGYVNLASLSEHHTSESTNLETLYPNTHQWIR